MTGPSEYRKIEIPQAKIEALINFLLVTSEGPAEATGMLLAQRAMQ